MANEWTPTEANALPWGETVEVKRHGKILKMSVDADDECGFLWWQADCDLGDPGEQWPIIGTEWRHISYPTDKVKFCRDWKCREDEACGTPNTCMSGSRPWLTGTEWRRCDDRE